MIRRLRHEAADRLKTVVPLRWRRKVSRLRLAGRTRSGRFRTLPDALIIGAQRCGTSSLYKYLGRHPNVAPSLRKEIEYFTIEHHRGEAWYRAHFPLRWRRRLAELRGRPWLTFEATPDYLFDPRAPQRVRELLPQVKLIVVLRDPVVRAVSQYHHNARLRQEKLPLAEALAAEEERLEGAYQEVIDHPQSRALELRRYSYVARGRYAEQLERWRRLFPPDQIMVVRSADLFDATGDTFGRILDFLGLSRWEPAGFRNHSYTDPSQGGYPEPSPEVSDFLSERLAASNQTLVELLGEDFRWDNAVRS